MVCEAMRIKTIPSQKEMRDFYNAAGAAEGFQANMYAPMHQPHQGRRLAQVKDLVSIILPFTVSKKVLEMGCADGLVTQWLAERANSVVATEVIRACIERCKRLELSNVKFLCGTLEAVKEEDFDLALACEVLEHCLDPELEMARLRSRARGILVSVPISEMPNEDAFSLEAGRNPKKPGDGSSHIWCFREDTVRALFEEVWHYWDDGISAILVGR